MNRPIRHIAWFVAILFFALLANYSVAAITSFGDYNSDSRNRRTRDAEFASDRGDILVGNTPVARTKAASGNFAYERDYSNGPLYATVTGYYSHDFGRTGLEQVYNEQLSGTADSQIFGRLMNQVTSQQPKGANVQTTINARAQEAAYKGLAGRKGAVVALDYTTGAVLAYVSTPSYDPSDLSTTDLTAQFKNWTTLNDDKSEPMLNRASREVYPPGSTFKLVVAAAALEAGKKPDDLVDSPAQMVLPTTTTVLGNEVNCGGDRSTIAHALAVSCNTAFANLGLELGADKLREQADKFGFDKPVESDINSVPSRFPASPDLPQTAMSSIGQFDVAATPLQMAMVAAGIANNGVLMTPYLASELVNPDLSTLEKTKPTKLSDPMTPENAKTLQDMMVGVVTDGTGTNAHIDGVRIGGKTGTAESSPDRPPYAWFVGFADDPKVAIAVFVEDAEMPREEIAGGRVSAPIFRSVVEALR